MENSKHIIQTIKSYCMDKLGVYETRPFGKYPICYRIMGKIFVQFNPEQNFYKITLKCNPEQAQVYRQLYPNIIVRGYHCPPVQQPYWNTIDLNNFSDINILFTMIDEAYDEVYNKLTKKSKKQFGELTKLRFVYTNGHNSDFKLLCTKLDQSLDELVGSKFERSQYNQYNVADSIDDVIIAYMNDTPIGCGGFKFFDEEHAELKRIYTEPAFRGNGLGEEIIRRLESKAKIDGYKWCILETGEPLQAACHIYSKMGYKVIENYGQYADMPESICMQRKI